MIAWMQWWLQKESLPLPYIFHVPTTVHFMLLLAFIEGFISLLPHTQIVDSSDIPSTNYNYSRPASSTWHMLRKRCRNRNQSDSPIRNSQLPSMANSVLSANLNRPYPRLCNKKNSSLTPSLCSGSLFRQPLVLYIYSRFYLEYSISYSNKIDVQHPRLSQALSPISSLISNDLQEIISYYLTATCKSTTRDYSYTDACKAASEAYSCSC